MRNLWALLLLPALAYGQGTQSWLQSRFDDFQKGTAKGVAVRSDGTLELAPAFQPVATTPSSYVWGLAADAAGNVYAASGSPARVYRVTPDGKVSIIFAPSELQVQAVAVDASGVVYAATSPDGKVYKITRGQQERDARPVKLPPAAGSAPAADPHAAAAAGKSSPAPEKARGEAAVDAEYTSTIFFDPGTKYIWDLELDREGRLYVATGDRGEIFRVNRNGEGARFFKSDEAHIRTLAFDPGGNLIAGSDGSGLVYRISPAGEGFVLYSANKKEITALAVDGQGNIFAAGVGEKRAAGALATQALLIALPAQQPPVTAPLGQPQQPVMPPPAFSPASRGSEVYVIAPQSTPRMLWSSREDIVYALALDGAGRLLAGSGNSGRIYRIERRGQYADLLKAGASQVSGFAAAPNGGLYVSTSNLGKIFLLGDAPGDEGTFESDVFDARILSRWGRAEARGSGSFDIYARSGNVDNPDRNWSPWKHVEAAKDAPLDVPAARFLQWRAVLRPSGAKLTPARVESVTVHYRPNNVAPVIEDVFVQAGARFNTAPRPPAGDAGPVTVGPPSGPVMPRTDAAPPAVRDRNSIAVRWVASDENNDDLTYSIYYRGDGESRWKLLKGGLEEKYYSWESALLPDGGYTVRAVATDAKSHPPDAGLTDSRDSERFEVDSTPPAIENLEAQLENGKLYVTFRGRDTFSAVRRAEYSIDAGEWRPVEPVGEVSDSLLEHYDFTVTAPAVATQPAAPAPPAGKRDAKIKRPEAPAAPPLAESGEPSDDLPLSEHVVVVRVYDRFDNMGSAKIVVRK